MNEEKGLGYVIVAILIVAILILGTLTYFFSLDIGPYLIDKAKHVNNSLLKIFNFDNIKDNIKDNICGMDSLYNNNTYYLYLETED